MRAGRQERPPGSGGGRGAPAGTGRRAADAGRELPRVPGDLRAGGGGAASRPQGGSAALLSSQPGPSRRCDKAWLGAGEEAAGRRGRALGSQRVALSRGLPPVSGLGHSARLARDSASSPRPLWASVSPAVGPPGSPALSGKSGEGSAEGAALVWRRRNSLALPGRGRPQRLPSPYPGPALTPAQPHLAPPRARYVIPPPPSPSSPPPLRAPL